MIAFPSMLIEGAKEAGISVPDEWTEEFEDNIDLIRDDYPHLFVYLVLQLGRPLVGPDSHWENAKVIAKITEEKIRTIDLQTIESMGFL